MLSYAAVIKHPHPKLLLNAAFIFHHCSSHRAMLPAASFYGNELLWLQAG
jgi:hypothetical protein